MIGVEDEEDKRLKGNSTWLGNSSRSDQGGKYLVRLLEQ